MLQILIFAGNELHSKEVGDTAQRGRSTLATEVILRHKLKGQTMTPDLEQKNRIHVRICSGGSHTIMLQVKM